MNIVSARNAGIDRREIFLVLSFSLDGEFLRDISSDDVFGIYVGAMGGPINTRCST